MGGNGNVPAGVVNVPPSGPRSGAWWASTKRSPPLAPSLGALRNVLAARMLLLGELAPKRMSRSHTSSPGVLDGSLSTRNSRAPSGVISAKTVL